MPRTISNSLKKTTTFSLLILIFIVSVFTNAKAQVYEVKGKTIDSKSKEALAFVSIQVNNSNLALTSDIDGNFSIYSAEGIKTIRFSYVGYENREYSPKPDESKITVSLVKKEIQLAEVIILPTENPAHRIVYHVIQNRDQNNPEKLNSFSFTAYNKMIFTANPDSLKKDTSKIDSNYIKAKDFLEKQHLFMMESVSEKKFLYPDKVSEKIIASKISGFKDPLIAMLVSQMQSFSFYKEYINLMDKNYLNPISKNSPNSYFFLIEDTLYQNKDSVFIISFRPLRNKNFDGLRGMLYINTNGWAVQNVIAEPAFEEEGGVGIKIQQKYELIEGKQWFPVQLNSDLIFKNVSLNNIKLIGEGLTYINDINLNPELAKKEFSNVEVEVLNSNTNEQDSLWKKYRQEDLSDKEIRTYQIIDSIGKKAHFDRSIRLIEALTSGRVPFKIVDIDLNRVIDFNDYEGFRVGFGLYTSKKNSKIWTLGGYFAYGFRDKNYKYGSDFEINLFKNHGISIGAAYSDDVSETGGVSFFEPNALISQSSYGKFLRNSFDHSLKKEAFLKFTAFKYLKVKACLTQTEKTAATEYMYGLSNDYITVLLNNFDYTEASIALCYTYKEKFVKTLNYKLSLGSTYPSVYFTYTRGIKGMLKGDFDYNRFDFKTSKTFIIKKFGKPTFNLIAGYINCSLPMGNLYSNLGSYRPFTIAAPGAFATMRMNEFLSDRYAALFFTHNFGKLLMRFKKFSPEFAIATNVGIGSLKNLNVHHNIEFKTMEKMYTESGIQINNLLSTGFYGMGLGVYYRYGNYALPTFKENVAYKFTLNLYF